jgi:hypothetical protein
MKSKHITKEIIDSVLWVNILFRGKVTFCGSLGLVLNGKLDRPIHDIDCITEEDLYGHFYNEIGKYGMYTSNSEKFELNGVEVKVFKIISPWGVNVDVMFRHDGVEWERVFLESTSIKVEKPEVAIQVKKDYLKIVNRTPNPEAVKKHTADLAYIALLPRKENDTIFIDGDFNDSYESKIQKSKKKRKSLPRKKSKSLPRVIQTRELTQKEKEKGRSANYWQMTTQEQWAEDKRLGILDWDGN